MKSWRTLLLAARGLGAAALMLLAAGNALADMPEGKITKDITVGANNDIPLKTGYVVQIMNQRDTKTVITVPLPDGSNGIFQIDSSDIAAVPAGTPLGLPAPPKPPPPPPGTVAPNYPAGFVGAPTFQTTQGDHGAGVASLIKLSTGSTAYVGTTRELLGPHGGFATQVAAKDVPGFVHDVQLALYSGSNAMYSVAGVRMPTGRAKAEGGKPVDDLALFRLQDPNALAQALPLADAAPAVGDVVWVIARLRNGAAGQVAQRGQVLNVGQWLDIQFDDANIITAGTSGAPVLDNAGQVVGILAGSINAGGGVRGSVIPAALIAQIIQKQKP